MLFSLNFIIYNSFIFVYAIIILTRKGNGNMSNVKVQSVPQSKSLHFSRKKWEAFKLFLYVLPGIAFIVLFHYVPLWGWSFSVFQYKPGRNLLSCNWVGLSNFTALFGNATLRTHLFRVLRNTFGIHLLGYLFSPLPMIFAVFLSELRSKRFQKVTQTVTTLPNFISWVIVYSLIYNLFSASGLVNNALVSAGILSEPVRFLTTTKHAWLYMVLLGEWKGLGWSAIIYFAAIAGIDQELYEAAMIDGAGRARRIWHITFPHLIPTYFVLLIMSVGKFLNNSVDQYMMFCNALNQDALEVLDLYVYNLGIGSGQISFSVAVGIMKSFVALALFSFANLLSKKVRGTSVF